MPQLLQQILSIKTYHATPSPHPSNSHNILIFEESLRTIIFVVVNISPSFTFFENANLKVHKAPLGLKHNSDYRPRDISWNSDDMKEK